ncbi:hypothetical protein ASE85_19850 [Sphingobium sp. Leaf26]|uniref:hypothetical protein n=1 Tax=Sphingobium sp. Leaf26 TaxID=1735693 RepID=UPI0006F9DEA4|nr:hypothetical protein [Sphingobium sp. Leaf26]KQN06577.1 hypothetical protein ASE85_19850 [Sphingobium sp. Leaf26]
MNKRAFAIASLMFFLAGCDAWPTVIDNRSGQNIKLRYHDSSYEEWSAPLLIRSDKAQRLALEHWVQDMVGLRINEGRSVYSFSYASLAPIRKACASNLVARRLKITPDCYITYLGKGQLSSSFAKPENLSIEDAVIVR